MSSRRVLIVGAGPVGLAAALDVLSRGGEPIVCEAGRPGDALRRWGATRFFTPLAMNFPKAALEILGPRIPPADALLTAAETVERVIEPLAAHPPLAAAIRSGTRVVSIGRGGLTRSDFPGHPIRGERPFRVLVETESGEETLEADAVLDASGVTGSPCAIGSGGVPCPGERRTDASYIRHLGDLERSARQLEGRSLLLVGHGHSAANAVLVLDELVRRAPATRVTWAVRTGNLRLCAEIAGDPLPERARVASAANDLAARPPAGWSVWRRAPVLSVASSDGDGSALDVVCAGARSGRFDRVLGFTGYRPDLSIVSELPVEISPSTEGAAGIARALAGVTDCLSVPRVRAEDLRSGEPGFFFVGAKSYGRSRNFLIRSGLEQLDTILDSLWASAG